MSESNPIQNGVSSIEDAHAIIANEKPPIIQSVTTEPAVAPTEQEPATQKAYETYNDDFDVELPQQSADENAVDAKSENEFTFETTASNVERTRPVQQVRNTDPNKTANDIIGISNLTEKEQLAFFQLPVWNEYRESKEPETVISNDYVEAIGNETDIVSAGNDFTQSLNYQGSFWQQHVPFKNLNIRAAKPAAESYTQGERLTGLKAIAKAQSTYDIGSPIVVPLWHSGLWLGFKAVSEEAFVSLIETIENEKISQGRNTAGAVFSNTKVYYYKHFIDFALKHLISSNLDNSSPEKLRKLIKINDIPIIAWALGCTMYPKGIKYRQACRHDPKKCQFVYDINLSLASINWVNINALTDQQRDFMLNRNEKRSFEDIEKYQKGFINSSVMGKTFISDDGQVAYHVETPSVEETITAGEAWLNDLAAAVREVISDGETDEERIEYRLGLSIIRNYSHYIKSIRFTQDDSYIDGHADINDVITTLSGNREVGVKILQDIKDFIDSSAINLIAIPRVNCKTVIDGETHKLDEEGTNPYLVVLDSLSLFFRLGVQKLQLKLSLRA